MAGEPASRRASGRRRRMALRKAWTDKGKPQQLRRFARLYQKFPAVADNPARPARRSAMADAADRLSPELIRRLIVRAADPGKRMAPPSQFTASLQTMSLGGLLGSLLGASGDLKRVVAANREGRIDPEMSARADELARRMNTPAPQPVAGPKTADEADLAAAEAALGFALPGAVRHLYAAVGNGGFGPGEGFLSLSEMVEEYRELTG